MFIKNIFSTLQTCFEYTIELRLFENQRISRFTFVNRFISEFQNIPWPYWLGKLLFAFCVLISEKLCAHVENKIFILFKLILFKYFLFFRFLGRLICIFYFTITWCFGQFQCRKSAADLLMTIRKKTKLEIYGVPIVSLDRFPLYSQWFCYHHHLHHHHHRYNITITNSE